MVDHSKTAQKSHVDSHVMLGHGIHGRRQKRSFQGDTLGDWSVKIDIRRREAYVEIVISISSVSIRDIREHINVPT